MKIKKKSRAEIEQVLDDAWLNIKVKEEALFNPLKAIPPDLEEDPHLYILWLFMQPEYFSFLCSQIFNINLLPLQAVILREIWFKRFPMLIANRGAGKSFLLGLYALLRLMLMPGRRIVICGSAFRQSKIIFNYMEGIWNNAPLLRDFVGVQTNGPKHDPDMYRFHIEEGVAVAVPIGSGERIRGLRANDILCDEFAAMSREIFENVIAGFAAVRSGPVESVKLRAKKKMAKELNYELDLEPDSYLPDNQIIISGTAYYDFNHFAEYWKRWRKIIHSKGDSERLAQIFGSEDIPIDFNWKDYSIIRIPYELMPPGFMDESMVARSQATMHSGIYDMEFGSIFSTDSNGFFKRSLIESCVVSGHNEIRYDDELVDFNPVLRGDSKREYVFGIDPASEIDNFSIVVLEVYKTHRRIVHAWSTTRSEHREKLKAGLVKDTDFYGYCARKIRDLMVMFPCRRIVMDSQGGGIAVSESLHDKDKLKEGEILIWPAIDPEKPKDTDAEAGLHLVELANFASAEWTAEANHGLRKDFEDKICLFPRFDPAMLELASIADAREHRLYDTLEDCIMEIEELKNELSIIIIEQTNSGRDRWTTPEVKLPGNKKGRLRKDRYSALVMANMGARQLMRNPPIIYKSDVVGGFATHIEGKREGPNYVGPSWFVEKMNKLF